MSKVRLDVLLSTKGLFPSREAARRAIMAGLVSKDGEVVDKPGTMVRPDDAFQVSQPAHQFVSRGGLKLERALSSFQFDMTGKVVLDIGASTGGFTDCALQHGAQHVFSVDVGYGQLAWKLRNDPRVTVMERVNFRHVDETLFQPAPEVVVMDVSFISIRLLFPKILSVLHKSGDIITLIKPQFEAGRNKVGKGGIVRDADVHEEVLRDILGFADSLGLYCHGLDYSPITGGDGNMEFLGWFNKSEGPPKAVWETRIPDLVKLAWSELQKKSDRND